MPSRSGIVIVLKESLCPLVLRIVNHVRGLPVFDHKALVHKQHVVGHLPRELHLMGDDDHGGVSRREGADDVQHLADHQIIRHMHLEEKAESAWIHGFRF